MTGLTAVLAFELHRRRGFVLLGLVVGLFVVAVPWLNGSPAPDQLRGMATAIASLGVFLLGGLLAGSGLFVDDLTSNRLSFSLSRPVGSAAIALARVSAAFLCVATATGLSVLPSALAGADLFGGEGSFAVLLGRLGAEVPYPFSWLTDWRISLLVVTPALLGVLGAGNALALLARVRSPWILLDLAAGILVGFALVASADLLALPGSKAFEGLLRPIALLLAGIGLTMAAAAQVTRGRVDASRAHRAFSATWFLAALVIGGSSLAFSAWYSKPTLSQLQLRSTSIQPLDGRWLLVHGRVDRPEPLSASFLVDRATHRSILLNARTSRSDREESDGVTERYQRVDQGRRILWFRESKARGAALMAHDLGADPLDSRPPGLFLEGPAWQWRASGDGLWVARIAPKNKATSDVILERTDGTGVAFVRSIPDSSAELLRILSVDQDTVRLLRFEPIPDSAKLPEGTPLEALPPGCRYIRSSRSTTSRWDAPTWRFTEVRVRSEGDIESHPLPLPLLGGENYRTELSADGTRLLVPLGQGPWAMLDSSSLELLGCIGRDVQDPEDRWLSPLNFLGDGRVAVRSEFEAFSYLRIYDSRAKILQEIELPAEIEWISDLIPHEGKLLLSSRSGGPISGRPWVRSLFSVDPSRGSVQKLTTQSDDDIRDRLLFSEIAETLGRR